MAEMLATKLSDAPEKQQSRWSNLRTLHIDFLQHWWDAVETEGTPMFPDGATLEQWEEEEEDHHMLKFDGEKTKCVGMKLANGKRHGPVRKVRAKDGYIIEETYKDDKLHG